MAFQASHSYSTGTFLFLISAMLPHPRLPFLQNPVRVSFSRTYIPFCIRDSIILEFPLPLVYIENSHSSFKAWYKHPLLYRHFLVPILT